MSPNPQSLIPNPDSDVRRFDEDRWLASRFAPAHIRERLSAIYALNHEIARAAETVATPALADIRVAWWREALDEIYAGKAPRQHPALLAFASAARHAPDHWSDIIEARRAESAATTLDLIDSFVERTAQSILLMALGAAEVSEEERARLAPAISDAARAWGYVGLARSAWFAAHAPDLAHAGLDRAEEAYASLRAKRADVPAAAFPAIGYVALVPGYLRTLRRGERDRPLLSRQLKLVAAAAAGKL